jgi:hypothetical protein
MSTVIEVSAADLDGRLCNSADLSPMGRAIISESVAKTDSCALRGRSVICESWALEAAVIPAQAGIQSVSSPLRKIYRVDFRPSASSGQAFRANDRHHDASFPYTKHRFELQSGQEREILGGPSVPIAEKQETKHAQFL